MTMRPNGHEVASRVHWLARGQEQRQKAHKAPTTRGIKERRVRGYKAAKQ